MRSETSAGETESRESTSTLNRVGSITRELQEALQALGAMPELQRVVREIPDARERLAYVGDMTEDAAHKVLNLVDTAQPLCRAQAHHAEQLVESLRRNAESTDLSVEHARRMLQLCAGYVERTAGFARQQSAVLTDIMLAQDFQDLSGQVIKKVIDMISRTERQLVQMLNESPMAAVVVEPAPPKAHPPQADALLEGPQTPDKALAQDDVDDLLASLGF